jgi:hypothetical protein
MAKQSNKSTRDDSSPGKSAAPTSGATDAGWLPRPSRLPLWSLPPW